MKKLLVPYSEYICTVQEYRGWDSRFDIQLWSDGQALPSSSITQACEILYYLKSVTFHQIPDLWGTDACRMDAKHLLPNHFASLIWINSLLSESSTVQHSEILCPVPRAPCLTPDPRSASVTHNLRRFLLDEGYIFCDHRHYGRCCTICS